jgi:hypothetical protein
MERLLKNMRMKKSQIRGVAKMEDRNRNRECKRGA